MKAVHDFLEGSCAYSSELFAATLNVAGSAAGSLLGGWIGRYLGRTRVLPVCNVPLSASWLYLSFAASPLDITIALFLLGLFNGMTFVTSGIIKARASFPM